MFFTNGNHHCIVYNFNERIKTNDYVSTVVKNKIPHEGKGQQGKYERKKVPMRPAHEVVRLASKSDFSLELVLTPNKAIIA